MTVRNLEFFFRPRSVALVGASDRPGSVGATILRNLVSGGFAGPVMPVNPRHRELAGMNVHASVADLPLTPELAVVCTPAPTVPGLIAELGARGTKAVVVITAGLGARTPDGATTLKEAMLAAARPHLLRILGPNCIGVLAPGIGLNASFAHVDALPGNVAFVSQSGALVTAVLDWTKSRGIGFSKFVSIGDSADVDFGDLIDHLASDPETSAILLYIESIHAARKFMSAARAAARNKPVIAVKAGRVAEGAKAAASHTGALAGADDVYDAAIRRAGMLRVLTTEDLFDAVETLARARPLAGDRLAIVTNGGGPGVMATDALVLGRGRLASFATQTIERLNAVLPATWSHGNPVDIGGDAPVARYVEALRILLAAPECDGVLFLHCPTAIVPSAAIAAALAPIAQQSARAVFACWLGADSVRQARQIFSSAGIPDYDTPESAVRAFLQSVEYRRNQELLLEVPPARTAGFAHDRERARDAVQRALRLGRKILSEADSKSVLAAYGVPIVATRIAADADDAVRSANELGYPVALKILSPQITHKSDVGGVVLDLETADAVAAAARAMHERVHRSRPDATLAGFTVQSMVRRPDAHELIVGVTTDPVFGPVILFGAGGKAVEVVADRAVGLPPLNAVLARDIVSRTRVAKLLAGYRDRPAADVDAIGETLLRISDLVADIPEVAELDINPLLADERGVVALDARIVVGEAREPGVARFAIKPYPAELEEWIEWHGSKVLLRPIRPEDGAQHGAFLRALQPDDVRHRVFIRTRELGPTQLGRLTQIDYDREMAFVAVTEPAAGRAETLGIVRAIADPDNGVAEFAIIVRSELKGRGLGTILLRKLIDYLRERGTRWLEGEALADNERVLALVRRYGFTRTPSTDGSTVTLRLALGNGSTSAQGSSAA
ncbi:MAG TPA: bifunctional acetate--CoA ligase family protein/GNAT family N-acetyltransferase [Casimicrobiaceae bacterium]